MRPPNFQDYCGKGFEQQLYDLDRYLRSFGIDLDQFQKLFLDFAVTFRCPANGGEGKEAYAWFTFGLATDVLGDMMEEIDGIKRSTTVTAFRKGLPAYAAPSRR